jgi:hypothetical protein
MPSGTTSQQEPKESWDYSQIFAPARSEGINFWGRSVVALWLIDPVLLHADSYTHAVGIKHVVLYAFCGQA